MTSTADNSEETGPTGADRARAIQMVLWVTLAANLAVAATQIAYGYWGNIVSLQADGFHSSFDALSNVIGLVALGIARRPPDVGHPYGHKRFEAAASLVVGFMVLLGFLEVGRAVWDAAAGGDPPQISAAAYGVVVASILVNLGISAWEHREGKRLDSMILKSDAAHTFTDTLAAGSVIVGMYLVESGIAVGDTLAALAVMGFIGMTAYRVLREGLDVLVDSSFLNPHGLQEFVENMPRVRSCHYVRSRGMPDHIHVDLHMSLDPDTRLDDAGEIMLEVKNALRDEYPDIEDILIQLEPHTAEYVEDVPDQLV